MKITYNWIKEFVDVDLPAESLADKLTMAGIEVKAVEAYDGDFVFEIEITSNRPDWLSVLGIAREVAAVTGKKLKAHPGLPGNLFDKAAAGKDAWKIDIEDPQDCPLYTAKLLTGVKVGPAPDWMRHRLEAVGCRSVNNVVDITNYVLYELGAPLHAFDADTLMPGLICIRRAKKDERLVTIDGQQRVLNPAVLVIADKQKPVAAAGVMGGKDTEVGPNTRNVLLEAAIFQPVVVRRGRQSLGLQTDASYRFERGIDTDIVKIASERASGLLRELAAAEVVSESGRSEIHPQKAEIILSRHAVNTMLGIDISLSGIKKILESLEFGVTEKTQDSVCVTVPSHRPDVVAQIDCIEEVARVYGFEHTPVSLSPVKPQAAIDNTYRNVGKLKSILTGLGLDEVITYSMVDIKSLPGYWDDEKGLVFIQTPLSEDQSVLRPVLMPGVARAVAYNIRQQQEYVAVFEIAKTFQKKGGALAEAYHVCAALCGAKSVWIESEKKHRTDIPGFLHLKGMAAVIFERLGISRFEFIPLSADCVDLRIAGKPAGILRRLSKDMLGRIAIKNKDVFAMELSLDVLWDNMNLKHKYDPVSRFPGISRDISVVVKDDVLTDRIVEQIKHCGGDFLQRVEIADFYKGSPIPEGHKNLTVSCFYRSNSRTLQEDEVNSAHCIIVEDLKKSFCAVIR